MPLKVVLFYNQNQRGWTETYYSPDDDPRVHVTNLDNFSLNSWIIFRHSSTQLIGIRASKIGDNRNSFFLPLTNFAGQSAVSGPNPFADVVSTDAVVRFTTGLPAVKRRIFLRGLADADVGRNASGTDAPSAQLSAGIDRLRKSLFTNGYQVRYYLNPPAGGLVFTRIVSVTAANLGIGFTDLIVDALPAGIAVGQRLRFIGVNHSDLAGFPRFASVVRFAGPPNATVTIPYRFRAQGPVSTPKGFFTTAIAALTNITGQIFERFSEHKTGRPTVTLRGRSRALVRSQ